MVEEEEEVEEIEPIPVVEYVDEISYAEIKSYEMEGDGLVTIYLTEEVHAREQYDLLKDMIYSVEYTLYDSD